MRTLHLATAVAGLTTFIATAAFAGSVTFSANVLLSTTNWNLSATLPQFDQTFGCLTSIRFTINGHVEGDVKFESLDTAPTTITTNLSATLTLTRPNNCTIVTTIPVVANSDNVSAYDGALDFSGTSGKTYSGLSGDKAESVC